MVPSRVPLRIQVFFAKVVNSGKKQPDSPRNLRYANCVYVIVVEKRSGTKSAKYPFGVFRLVPDLFSKPTTNPKRERGEIDLAHASGWCEDV